MTDWPFDLCAVALFGAVLALGIAVGYEVGFRLASRAYEREMLRGWRPAGEDYPP